MTLCFLSILISGSCGRQAPPPKEDYEPPTIRSTIPDNQSLDNDINTAITVIFSEIIDPASVTSETISVRDAMTDTPVAGDITHAGSTIIFRARSPLQVLTVYVLRLTTGVRDLAGNAMLYPMTLTFTTGVKGDSTAPDVLQTTPGRGAVNIGVNTMVGVTFTEPMLESTITSTLSPLTLMKDTVSIAGRIISFDGRMAIYAPFEPLEFSTTYTVTLSDSVTDLAGNHPLWGGNPYTWEFTTQMSDLDNTQPQVKSTVPSYDANNVSVNSPIVAVFDETLMASSVTVTTFVLTEKQAGSVVPGQTAAIGAVAMFTPANSLKCATDYLVTLVSITGGAGISDTSGNLIVPNSAQGYSWGFTTETAALTVIKAGTGSGLVSASSGTLVWAGNIGTATYADYGAQVTLHAAASEGSTFAGWSGEGCSGTGDCTVTMTAARNVTATFMYDSYLLTVTKNGTGSGIVTASTGTLLWIGNTGTAVYPDYGTLVTLHAAASSGSTFAGWSGEGCSGTGDCTVTMTAARNVTATFTVYTYVLTVTKTGKGSGTVEVNPGTLAWAGKTGTATYNYNTLVTLTPIADPGSTFTGWSGEGCSGTGTCTVTMTAPRAVDAAFNK